jgi:hypothetical protein
VSTRRLRKHLRFRQLGQAYAEYIVILVAVILVLIVGGENSVINLLLTAFRDFYRSYSYAIALP